MTQEVDKYIGCFYPAKVPNMLFNFYITSEHGILTFPCGLSWTKTVPIPASRSLLVKSCAIFTSIGSACPKAALTTTRWKQSLVTSSL